LAILPPRGGSRSSKSHALAERHSPESVPLYYQSQSEDHSAPFGPSSQSRAETLAAREPIRHSISKQWGQQAMLRGRCPPPRGQMHLSPWWKSKSTSLTPKSSMESSKTKIPSRNPSEYHDPQVRKVVLSVPISKMSRSSPKVKRSLGLEVNVREDTSLWRSIGKYREKEELGSCQHVECPKRGWPILGAASRMLRGHNTGAVSATSNLQHSRHSPHALHESFSLTLHPNIYPPRHRNGNRSWPNRSSTSWLLDSKSMCM
jgi:hypothetical protein